MTLAETIERSETLTDTQSAILDAARKQFAARGFSGTSMKMIARAANINQSLIHYHFESKQDLWSKVYDWYALEYVRFGHDNAPLENSTQPISDLIDKLHKFAVAYPEYSKFVTWSDLEPDLKISDQAIENWRMIVRGIETAQSRGFIRSDVSPQIVRNIIASSVFTGFRIEMESNNQPGGITRSNFLEDMHKTLNAAFHPPSSDSRAPSNEADNPDDQPATPSI